jgi:hypothetical protein
VWWWASSLDCYLAQRLIFWFSSELLGGGGYVLAFASWLLGALNFTGLHESL